MLKGIIIIHSYLKGGHNLNIPNSLTLLRVFLAPIFILVFFSGISHPLVYSAVILLVAGITDLLDGYIARKKNLITKWGTAFDPLADKFILLAVLICFTAYRYIPIWLFVIFAIKEVLMITGGIHAATKSIYIPANLLGKFATALFYLFVFTFVSKISYSIYILYLSATITVTAFFKYLYTYLKIAQKAL